MYIYLVWHDLLLTYSKYRICYFLSNISLWKQMSFSRTTYTMIQYVARDTDSFGPNLDMVKVQNELLKKRVQCIFRVNRAVKSRSVLISK